MVITIEIFIIGHYIVLLLIVIIIEKYINPLSLNAKYAITTIETYLLPVIRYG